MTVLSQENFGGGTIGNPVLASQTIFSNVTGGCTYIAGLDTDGSNACRLGVSGTGGVRESGFAMSKAVFRFIIDTQTLPAANAEFANVFYFDGTVNVKAAAIRITPAGKLIILNINSAAATSTTDVSTGVFALEWMVDLAADTQELRIYSTLSLTATPVETLTGPATSPGSTLVQFQAGRYTSSALLWDIDSYKRADDWVAAPVAHTWDIHFDGTVGNPVVVGLPIVEVGTPAPVYAAGGVATSQIRGHIAPTVAATGVKTSFGSNPAASWERFYYEPENVLSSESYNIWRMESDAGTVGARLAINNPTGQPKLGLLLLDGNDAQIGSGYGIPQQTPFRVEIDAHDSGGVDTGIEVQVFYGDNLHGLTPNFSVIGDSVGFTQRKNRWIRKAASASARGAYFDEWSGSTSGWVGPITDPTPQPLAAQWRFWEHHAATPDNPTLLTPSYWVGGQEVPLDIGATTVKGDVDAAAARFYGDPGDNKIQLGWFVEGGNYDKIKAEVPLMQTIVPNGSTAMPTLKPAVFRDFNAASGLFGTTIFGTHHADKTQDIQAREAIRDGMIYFGSWDMGLNSVFDLLDGLKDSWLQARAVEINDIRTRYDGIVCVCCANEPDNPGEGWYNKPDALKRLRNAARYIKSFMQDAGCTNFNMMTPTYMQGTFQQSQTRLNNANLDDPLEANWYPGANTALTTATRWDAWYMYHPDWMGEDPLVGPQTWTDALTPNPANFYWGADRKVDLIAANSYCFHVMDGAP